LQSTSEDEMSLTEELSRTLRDLYARLAPALVSVGRRGSGFVLPGSAELIVTNAHHLSGEPVSLLLTAGAPAPADLVGVDVDQDLAVLRARRAVGDRLEWSTRGVEVGDFVFAAARPAGVGLRVTVGTVTSVDRSFRGPRGRTLPSSIEHTAPLPRGASGGPLLDAAGGVVGINTHRLQDGFYLALPAAEQVERLAALARGQWAARPRLGLALVPPQAARRLREAVGLEPVEGLLVRSVEDDGPAAAAGIRRGDVITSVAGSPTADLDQLMDALDGAGSSFGVELARGDQAISVTVTR
jgi:serine protease Do